MVVGVSRCQTGRKAAASIGLEKGVVVAVAIETKKRLTLSVPRLGMITTMQRATRSDDS